MAYRASGSDGDLLLLTFAALSPSSRKHADVDTNQRQGRPNNLISLGWISVPFCLPLSRGGRPRAPSQCVLLHEPFAFQSWTTVVTGSDDFFRDAGICRC